MSDGIRIRSEQITSYAWAKANCSDDQKIIFDNDGRALLAQKGRIDYLMDKAGEYLRRGRG